MISTINVPDLEHTEESQGDEPQARVTEPDIKASHRAAAGYAGEVKPWCHQRLRSISGRWRRSGVVFRVVVFGCAVLRTEEREGYQDQRRKYPLNNHMNRGGEERIVEVEIAG